MRAFSSVVLVLFLASAVGCGDDSSAASPAGGAGSSGGSGQAGAAGSAGQGGAGGQQPSISFKEELATSLLKEARSMALGDLNGDKKLDVVAVNANNKVTVWLGQGDGTLQPSQQVEVPSKAGSYLVSVTTFDFNGDGKTDLALGNSYSTQVSLLPGNGDGTFQDEIPLEIGHSTSFMVTGDFNGDGTQDLVIKTGAGQLSVALLSPKGKLLQKVNYKPHLLSDISPTANDAAVGDFDGDSKLDFVVTNNNGSNQKGYETVFLNKGDGIFEPLPSFQIGYDPDLIRVGDLDGDKKLDIVTASHAGNSVRVQKGNGDGTFASEVELKTNTFIWGLGLGDFNQDGKLDIMSASAGKRMLDVQLGQGDGTFQPMQSFALTDQPTNLSLGDFNNDGKLDAATVNQIQGSITVMLNTSP